MIVVVPFMNSEIIIDIENPVFQRMFLTDIVPLIIVVISTKNDCLCRSKVQCPDFDEHMKRVAETEDERGGRDDHFRGNMSVC